MVLLVSMVAYNHTLDSGVIPTKNSIRGRGKCLASVALSSLRLIPTFRSKVLHKHALKPISISF